MQKFNTVTLNITVAILDFLYEGRDYPRFWVLGRDSKSTILCFFKCASL